MACRTAAAVAKCFVFYPYAGLMGFFLGIPLLLKSFVSLFTNNAKQKARKEPPEILVDPKLGEHAFIQLQDSKLHYVHKGSKENELMLFIHGFPEFWFSWRHQMEEFSKDYWTVAIDMRGYGDSERRSNTSWYNIDSLVSDVHELIKALGKEKCVLVAHDWGGLVAHDYIRTHPETLHTYILMNTGFLGSAQRSIYTIPQIFKSWYIFFISIPWLPEYAFSSNDLALFDKTFAKLSKEEIEAYKYTFRDYEHLKAPLNYYRANFKPFPVKEKVTVDKLNKSGLKGLYIHGMDDVAITEHSGVVSSWEGVEKVEKVKVPGEDHFLNTSAPKKVNSIMRKFLKDKMF